MPRTLTENLSPLPFTAATAPQRLALRKRVLRYAVLCLRESRWAVLAIFLLRFLLAGTGGRPLALSRPALLLGAAAWLFAVVAVYLYNGVTDLEEDRSNHSKRPLASGTLPVDRALHTAAALAVLAVAAGAVLSPAMGALTAAFLLLGYAYSAPRIALKRRTPGTIAVATGGGALTYGAGLLCGATAPAPALLAFAAALSLWMGMVGAVTKDFSDTDGDALGGRRNWTLLWGRTATAALVSVCAVTIGAGLLVCALTLNAPSLLVPGLVLLGAALALAAVSLTTAGHRSRARRRVPYRIYMVAQYAAHAAVFAHPIT